jgi:hypothetical protein
MELWAIRISSLTQLVCRLQKDDPLQAWMAKDALLQDHHVVV